MIHIDSWYGRFGNNIQQLVHAFILAEKKGYDISYINHPYFKVKEKTAENYEYESDFFSRPNFEKNFFKVNTADIRRVCLEKVLPLLKFKQQEVPEDVYVAHVRNGDIFNHNPHSGFVQPPLSYYKAIFKKENITDLSKVWVVCSEEVPANPVVKHLEELGCTVKKEDFDTSASILLGAKNCIMCRSSFSHYLFLCSLTAKKIYAPDYYTVSGVDDLSVYKVNISNYIKPGEWKANQAQIKMMLELGEENIIIEKL